MDDTKTWRPITVPIGKPSASAALEAAGYPHRVHDGVHMVHTDHPGSIAAQALVDAYDPLPAARARAIGLVKQEARRRILERYPDWKQANMTAEAVTLVAILSVGGTLTAEQAARQAQLEAAWAWIAAVRTRSNEYEADLEAEVDAMAINGFDPAVAAWPA